MTESVFVDTAKHICFWMTFSFITMAAFSAHAATVNYTLDNVILADGQQMTGEFSWTFDINDFQSGVGQWTFLDIPWTSHNQDDLTTTFQVDSSIEITLDGSVHDDGVDITLFLVQPLTPTTSSLIDLVSSKYEIGGNGFHDGLFLSGSVSPNNLPGDGNGDGWVDGLDYLLWAGSFGTHPDVDGDISDGDYNDDGWVDGLDYLLWAGNFGTHNANIAVPEPAGLATALLAFVAFLTSSRRRRRYVSTSTIFASNSGECGVA